MLNLVILRMLVCNYRFLRDAIALLHLSASYAISARTTLLLYILSHVLSNKLVKGGDESFIPTAIPFTFRRP